MKYEKRNCPECGWLFEEGGGVVGDCPNCQELAKYKKQNLSLQMIFRHLKATHNWNMFDFDSFLVWVQTNDDTARRGLIFYEKPLSSFLLDKLKTYKNDWYVYLLSVGLIHRKMVTRESWVNVYMKDGRAEPGNGIFNSEEEAETWAISYRKKYIKSILLHSWTEEKK